MIDIATPILDLLKKFFLLYWRYILLFLVFIIAGVLLQIRILRNGRHNKLPAWFNRLVGSVTYSLFFALMTAIAYWLFGPQILDKGWFMIFNLISYPMTKFFLIKIGFWYY